MDLLKQSLAPIADEAWKEINGRAQSVLKGNLSARGLVDFRGPKGADFAAVATGRVDWRGNAAKEGVAWGLRRALPLVEVRVPFSLDLADLDDVTRGAKDPQLEPLEEAARQIALFEEKAVYSGLKSAGLVGIAEASPHKTINLTRKSDDYQPLIEAGVVTLQEASIGGPYELVLGTEPYQRIMQGDQKGYPLLARLKDVLLGGNLHWSPAPEGAVLLARREGNYELTVGMDLAIGYAEHTARKVVLYFTETFAFQVWEPRAAVMFGMKA